MSLLCVAEDVLGRAVDSRGPALPARPARAARISRIRTPGSLDAASQTLSESEAPTDAPREQAAASGASSSSSSTSGESASTGTMPPSSAQPAELPAKAHRRAAFLQQSAGQYGYAGQLGKLRLDFPQLAGQVYVDHAGAAAYSRLQLAAVFEVCLTNHERPLAVSTSKQPVCSMAGACSDAAACMLTLHECSDALLAMQDMAGSLYSNPHSLHGDLLGDRSSMAAEQEARRLVLAMCNAPPEQYTCIFTSGATGQAQRGFCSKTPSCTPQHCHTQQLGQA